MRVVTIGKPIRANVYNSVRDVRARKSKTSRTRRIGREVNDQWLGLGRELQPYETASKTMQIDQAQARGYYEEDFQEAFQRYMSRSSWEVE